MSKTLNLVQGVFARACELQRLGLEAEAQRLFTKLAELRDLPVNIATETHSSLAQSALKQRQFAKARRHLSVALSIEPYDAELNYLMAVATSANRTQGPKAAARYFRRSLRLEPKQPRCWMEYGLAALRQGRTKDGLSSLHRAFELDPDDPELVAKMVEGMRRQRFTAEARSVARTTLFRNWRNPRFRQLLDRLRFQEAHAAQNRARRPRTVVPKTPLREVTPSELRTS